MDTETIEYEDKRLGFIVRHDANVQGKEFLSPDEDFMQIGYMNLKKGEKFSAHFHKIYSRTINKTQKAIYLISGKMKFEFYNNEKKKIKEVIINAGDLIVLLDGGFGFEFLEDGKMIEIKQGPYIDVEHDKEKFEPLGD